MIVENVKMSSHSKIGYQNIKNHKAMILEKFKTECTNI